MKRDNIHSAMRHTDMALGRVAQLADPFRSKDDAFVEIDGTQMYFGVDGDFALSFDEDHRKPYEATAIYSPANQDLMPLFKKYLPAQVLDQIVNAAAEAAKEDL